MSPRGSPSKNKAQTYRESLTGTNSLYLKGTYNVQNCIITRQINSFRSLESVGSNPTLSARKIKGPSPVFHILDASQDRRIINPSGLSRCHAARACNGRSKWKQVPRCSSLTTRISLACNSRIRLAIARPRPVEPLPLLSSGSAL